MQIKRKFSHCANSIRGDWQETARTLKHFVLVVDVPLPSGYACAVSAAMFPGYERYKSGRAL